MGSKLLLLTALLAAGILAFVVISSLSDGPVDTGQGRAVKPDENEEQIVAPPALDDDATAEEEALVGEPGDEVEVTVWSGNAMSKGTVTIVVGESSGE